MVAEERAGLLRRGRYATAQRQAGARLRSPLRQGIPDQAPGHQPLGRTRLHAVPRRPPRRGDRQGRLAVHRRRVQAGTERPATGRQLGTGARRAAGAEPARRQAGARGDPGQGPPVSRAHRPRAAGRAARQPLPGLPGPRPRRRHRQSRPARQPAPGQGQRRGVPAHRHPLVAARRGNRGPAPRRRDPRDAPAGCAGAELRHPRRRRTHAQGRPAQLPAARPAVRRTAATSGAVAATHHRSRAGTAGRPAVRRGRRPLRR